MEAGGFIYDTHGAVRRLTDAGFSDRQAVAIAGENLRLIGHNFATRGDIEALQAATKADTKGVRDEIEKLRLTTEARFEELRLTTEARFEELRLTTEARFEESRLAIKARLEESRLAIKARLEESRLATKARLEESRLATKARLEESRLATKADIATAKTSTIIWIVGLVAGLNAAMLGIPLLAMAPIVDTLLKVQ